MSEVAVIKTGGKQYLVAEGDVLRIEKLLGEHKVGDTLTFNEVLLRDNGSKTTLGTPLVKDARVECELTEMGRGKKIDVVKFKQKSRYHKRRGHRQPYFAVKVKTIA